MIAKDKTIAIFIPTLQGGGAERVTAYLASGLADRGLSVDLVLNQAIGPYLAFISDRVRIVELHARRVITGIFPLARYLRSRKPAVLLTALEHATIGAFLAKRISGVATCMIPTVHSTLSQILQHHNGIREPVVNRTVSWCYRRSDAVVAVSQGVADDMVHTVKMPADRVRVIYPILTMDIDRLAEEPVNHRWFAPGQPGVILAVGRLSAQKDFITLLKAYAIVGKHVSHRLLILGEGPQRSELEQLVGKLGLGDRVDMPGHSTNVFAYMARCSLFVLSSGWEAMPMVITEALAAGAPVVATDCESGPREILRDGEYGRLVPVGDVEKMAEAILQALAEPRRGVAEAALRPFARETIVDQYCELIEEFSDA